MAGPITVTDTTADPEIVTDGNQLAAYKGVTVADTDALSTTETVSITLSQVLNQTPGANYYFYPMVTDFGSITDPNGGGTWNPTTETFTESGVVGGDPTFASSLLTRLVYKAPSLPNGQAFATQAAITVTNGATTTTDSSPVIVGDVAPPAITGTVADEPIASGDKIPPFATLNVTEPYFDYNYYTITGTAPNTTYAGGPNYDYAGKVSATITITDGGTPTDADGLLTGPGVSKTGAGTYSLSAVNSYNLQSELRGLSFQTVAVAAGQTQNPAFEVDVTDTTSGLTTKDTTTSVLVIGPALVPVAPTIAGTLAGQTVSPGNTIDPFASVTVSDTNANPTDSVTITLTGAGGTATDTDGTLTGTGLTETTAGSGIYTLAATTPTALTTELDALTFHPTGLPSGATSVTTNFALAVSDPGFHTPATDTKTSVVETAPAAPPPGNFTITDETTGQTTSSAGEPYSGPVAGLSNDIMLVTSDNVNVTGDVPNVFINLGGSSGEDGIQVNSGANVLNGSTNSSFLIGGTGDDTFYVDDRNPPDNSNLWSTVVNFHAGDAATIWGVTEAGFAITEANGLGATGSTGLTFDFSQAGHPDAKLTLAGFSTTNLSNGTLGISFGTSPTVGSLPGSVYMQVRDV